MHHLNYADARELLEKVNIERDKEELTFKNIRISYGDTENINLDKNIDEPLTVIVALAEWFAQYMGFKNWSMEMENKSHLFMAEQIITELMDDDMLSPEGIMQVIRQEIIDEYNKANVLNDFIEK